MGGSTIIEGVNDRANMIETQKTFTLLGKWKHPIPGVAIFSKKAGMPSMHVFWRHLINSYFKMSQSKTIFGDQAVKKVLFP